MTSDGLSPITLKEFRNGFAGEVIMAGDPAYERYDQKLWNPEPEGERGVPSHLT